MMIAVVIVVQSMGQHAGERIGSGDEQRKADVALVVKAIDQYQTEHNGRLPESVVGFESYAKEKIKPYTDPDGVSYVMVVAKMYEGVKILSKMDHTLYVMTNARCDGERIAYTEQVRKYAVAYRLDHATYCVDNW